MEVGQFLWPTVILCLVVLGLLPGFALRLIVRLYPKHHPRRSELVAELYVVPYKDRLLFVAQHLELAISEGLPARFRTRPDVPPTPRASVCSTDGFRGPQVCSIVGITYRQLDYWARTDLLRPSISEARRNGTQRRYSYRDLLECKVIKRLLDAGVSLRSARRAMEVLRSSRAEVATANLGSAGASRL